MKPITASLCSRSGQGGKSIHHWEPALQSFQIMFGEERVPLAAL